MEIGSIQSPTAALVAGLVSSLHCVGMCGPLACWLRPAKAEDATIVFASYQGARLGSYLILGTLAGRLGQGPLSWLRSDLLRFLPWCLVLFFIGIALRLDRRIPKPMILVRTGLRLQTWARTQSGVVAALVLGGATPLLPCGPLYFVAVVASFTGSATRGAEFMLAFGLGTLPLLWFAQAQFGWLRARVSPVRIQQLQLALAVVSAVVLTWRLRSTLGFGAPGTANWVCF